MTQKERAKYLLENQNKVYVKSAGFYIDLPIWFEILDPGMTEEQKLEYLETVEVEENVF